MNLASAPQWIMEMSSRSHPGMVRRVNQDSVSTIPELGLAVLADGLGGYRAGEVAADMATRQIIAGMASDLQRCAAGPLCGPALHSAIRQRINEAGKAIHHLAQHSFDHAGMGTTLVMAVFAAGVATIAHVGDSRLYRLREGHFEQLTRDHSLLQEQVDAGLVSPDEARDSQDRNLVTRALGIAASVTVDIADHTLAEGDLYLLCSDGLTDMLPDSTIRAILLPSGINLEQAASRLIELANRNGGRDNVSLVLARADCGVMGNPLTAWLNRWRSRGRAWRS